MATRITLSPMEKAALECLKAHPQGLTAAQIAKAIGAAPGDFSTRRLHLHGYIRRRTSDKSYHNVWVLM